MRFNRINNWQYKDDLNCMLFFAQLLDEMLFNYTIDTYKQSALNTNSLCDEALIIIEEIEKNVISKGALISILEELQYNLKNDIVSEKLLGNQLNQYIKNLKNQTSLRTIGATVFLIKKVFADKSYYKMITEQLKEKILKNKEKEKITKLSRLFITELINNGYDKNYIYNRVNNFFFNKLDLPPKN